MASSSAQRAQVGPQRGLFIRSEMVIAVDHAVVAGWAQLEGELVTVGTGLSQRSGPLSSLCFDDVARSMLTELARDEITPGLR